MKVHRNVCLFASKALSGISSQNMVFIQEYNEASRWPLHSLMDIVNILAAPLQSPTWYHHVCAKWSMFKASTSDTLITHFYYPTEMHSIKINFTLDGGQSVYCSVFFSKNGCSGNQKSASWLSSRGVNLKKNRTLIYFQFFIPWIELE